MPGKNVAQTPHVSCWFDDKKTCQSRNSTDPCCHISKTRDDLQEMMIQIWDKSGKAGESSIPVYPKKNKKRSTIVFSLLASKTPPFAAWWYEFGLEFAYELPILFSLPKKKPPNAQHTHHLLQKVHQIYRRAHWWCAPPAPWNKSQPNFCGNFNLKGQIWIISPWRWVKNKQHLKSTPTEFVRFDTFISENAKNQSL